MIKFKIDDADWYLELPANYSDPSRLTWKCNMPGVWAVNQHGKSRFFRAKREGYGKAKAS